jgi:uncharacterized protein YndB with AHSA1/START domain
MTIAPNSEPTAETTRLVTEGDTRIVITRRFAAAPAHLFRAHTQPDLIRRWMVGPEGWTMPVCQSDSRPGGSFRFEWSDGRDVSFHATGEYLEVTPRRILHVERMFLPDPTPDNHVETRFDPLGSGTAMTVTMTLATAEARAAILASGMTEGLEDSYARLDQMFGADNG